MADRLTPLLSDVVPAPDASVRRRVLVIDDDPRLARSIQVLLADTHDVEIETSASRACARLLGDEMFDAVLCDVMMRDMTGMDLFEKLSAGRPTMARRMVFMTGGAFTARARAFLESATNPCLDKPFVRADLLRAIASRAGVGAEDGAADEETAGSHSA
jgi:CheY-like chemotaxis protein